MSHHPAHLETTVAVASDPVTRWSALAGLLVDLPDTVVLQYDVVGGDLVRKVLDVERVVFADVVGGDEDCVSCAVRADLHASLGVIADLGRWSRVVVAPPVTAAPAPVLHELLHAHRTPARTPLTVRAVVAFVDGAGVQADVLGDDLLVERDLALGPADRRSMGEAVTDQVEFADVVVATSAGSTGDRELLRLLAGRRARVVDDTELLAESLFELRHDYAVACERIDPLAVVPRATPGTESGCGEVWALDLHSDRPVHPARLLDRITALGTGRIRARGHLWLASRPATPCLWDASGGQLSIGAAPGWSGVLPASRVRVVGTEPADRARIAEAFAGVTMSSDELAGPWPGADDLDPWLGRADS